MKRGKEVTGNGDHCNTYCQNLPGVSGCVKKQSILHLPRLSHIRVGIAAYCFKYSEGLLEGVETCLCQGSMSRRSWIVYTMLANFASA